MTNSRSSWDEFTLLAGEIRAAEWFDEEERDFASRCKTRAHSQWHECNTYTTRLSPGPDLIVPQSQADGHLPTLCAECAIQERLDDRVDTVGVRDRSHVPYPGEFHQLDSRDRRCEQGRQCARRGG